MDRARLFILPVDLNSGVLICMKSLLVMLYDIKEKWVSQAAGAVPVAVHPWDYDSGLV